MSTIDIRFEETPKPITTINFADKGINPIVGKGGSAVAAHCVHRPKCDEHFVQIRDNSNEFVNIVSVAHARNLIKALERAIQLGWLK
ncbi:hypothetical protein Roomu2_00054 [Pseudomonas phage vB_PpuM-Roomu-2]|uniref:Uncharacterized protein n=1 Tax=Pseudomonas phage vB_PpuM-Roomu-2 TaxID=3132621 RepID=A0AAX4MZ31_9CAUD